MSVFVADASVVVKWFVPEVHSGAARMWLDAQHDYVAPDLLFPEVGNAIWKKVRRGEIAADDAQRLVDDISEIGVEAVSTRTLASDAHALALATGLTVYDAMYLTLAVRLETQVVTGDERLARKLTAHPLLAAHVRAASDLPPE